MKRRSLIFIGLLSAIVTIISLNFAFGRSWNYYNRYSYFRRYHQCYNYHDEHNYQRQQQQNQPLQSDSSTAQ